MQPRPETLIQHLAEEEPHLGAVAPPIYQNSIFSFPTWEDMRAGFDPDQWSHERHNYSRVSNPTCRILERKLAALEHTEDAKVFASGMAAISAAIFSCVEAGSHVVCVDTCYGPTRQLLTEFMTRFGVATTFVTGEDTNELVAAIRPETMLLYLESPSSIVFRIQDLAALCRVAKERGITTAIDNSYATPIFQTPADFGVDIVLHTASKYINGHSDVIAGVLCTSAERMKRLVRDEVSLLGAALPPFPAWLVLRGLRTLPVRMRAHQEAGNTVAAWLAGRADVARVFHVGDPRHPQRARIDAQMRGSVGLVSFEPTWQDEAAIGRFLDALALFHQAVSWGGFESLAVALQFHPMDWPEARWLVRLSLGLEAVPDLIADLEAGFAAANG